MVYSVERARASAFVGQPGRGGGEAERKGSKGREAQHALGGASMVSGWVGVQCRK